MKLEDINKEIENIKWCIHADSAWLTPQRINSLVDKLEQFKLDVECAYSNINN